MSRRALLVACLCMFAQITCLSAFADNSRSPGKSYSITISGGVSLGIYEAGVNWAIVEAIKNSTNRTLHSVTGASAGAVNTVLTGLRYCEAGNGYTSVIDNQFYHTWNVQLADLLPERSDYGQLKLARIGRPHESTVLEDSVFSRSVYVQRLHELSGLVADGKFRSGCEIDIAIVVTRVEPEYKTFGTGDGKLQVPSQRYVVPLTITAQGQGKNPIATGVSFKNNLRYSGFAGRSGNYLYLPEESGIVAFDTVARAVMASSAFPLVFGPVEMDYCLPVKASTEIPVVNNRAEGINGNSIAEANCPANHYFDSNFFVDGGVFDNVPVGVAVDLVKASDTGAVKEGAHSYIFLNPEDTVVGANSGSEPRLKTDYTFDSQLEALLPLLTTLRKQVLADSLADNFGADNLRADNFAADNAPRLLLTRRSLPIVGTYLQNFGAFFDESFFYHDYAAGIFDGINSVVEFFCEDTVQHMADNECRNGSQALQEELLDTLVFEPLHAKAQSHAAATATGSDSNGCESERCDAAVLLRLMQAFYRHSQSVAGTKVCPSDDSYLSDSSGGIINKTLAVLVVLCDERFDNFEALISALDAQRTDTSGLFKKRRWVYGDEVEFVLGKRLSPWTFGFLEKSLQRLLDLETKYQGSSANAFSAAWAMIPGSDNSNRAVLQRNRALAHVSPDYIGIDGLQSGIAVAWDWALPLPEFNCKVFPGYLTGYCENYRVMFGASAQFRRVVNERDRFNTSSVFVGVDFSRPENFLHSSSGIRFVRSADYLPIVDHDTNYETYSSIEFYSRFFGNKIEVSLGFEGDSLSLGQDDLRLKIGLYDVDRFLALMCPSCF